MNDSELIYAKELELIDEIESEKKFMTIGKLFKIFELDALLRG